MRVTSPPPRPGDPASCGAGCVYTAAAEAVQASFFSFGAPTNGGFYPGTVDYTCDFGYRVAGLAPAAVVQRRCTTAAGWSPAPPVCVGVPCDALPAPADGAVAATGRGRAAGLVGDWPGNGYGTRM